MLQPLLASGKHSADLPTELKKRNQAASKHQSVLSMPLVFQIDSSQACRHVVIIGAFEIFTHLFFQTSQWKETLKAKSASACKQETGFAMNGKFISGQCDITCMSYRLNLVFMNSQTCFSSHGVS